MSILPNPPPNLAPAYQLRGAAYHEKQDYDDALADFNAATPRALARGALTL